MKKGERNEPRTHFEAHMKNLLGILRRQDRAPIQGHEPVHIDSPADGQRSAGAPLHGGFSREPVRTGSPPIAFASPEWRSPTEHAVQLLEWMQRPGGKIGQVPASELMAAHIEMCGELYWEPLPWIPVAKALRRLLNDTSRHYTSRNGRRVLVYLIPRSTSDLAAGYRCRAGRRR